MVTGVEEGIGFYIVAVNEDIAVTVSTLDETIVTFFVKPFDCAVFHRDHLGSHLWWLNSMITREARFQKKRNQFLLIIEGTRLRWLIDVSIEGVCTKN
jgi:hypothetical protein